MVLRLWTFAQGLHTHSDIHLLLSLGFSVLISIKTLKEGRFMVTLLSVL